MYFWEWLMYDGRDKADYDELTRRTEKAKKEGRGTPTAKVNQSLSSAFADNDSLYAYNYTYMDVRTSHDEKRGLITLFLGFALGLLCWMLVSTMHSLIDAMLNGITRKGNPLVPWDYFFLTFNPFIPLVALYVYFKYFFCYLRLEAFTARRLIVRFNRVTRKVYLLRPKNIGGIVALDWDKTEAAVDQGMRREVPPGGGFLCLAWDKGAVYDVNGDVKNDFEISFVGRTARNGAELLEFWEYIRRYMEIGPEAAPPPKKLLSKTPWPWLSFEAAWNILPLRGLRETGMWPMFVLVKVMLLPVTLIHATGHWISLLLCYEPKFPPSIKNAGK
ncbi:DUF6708 domain-containing protein [Paraburkholderia tropica]|uniref:DUF6708 domain-containing protein n=1 Tax=Paraburkholderia tropica TaxID=92647 RepID=UPI002ABE2C64|nr:DUF6708 domain-containing protein [Paraburkholderia tropica]